MFTIDCNSIKLTPYSGTLITNFPCAELMGERSLGVGRSDFQSPFLFKFAQSIPVLLFSWKIEQVNTSFNIENLMGSEAYSTMNSSSQALVENEEPRKPSLLWRLLTDLRALRFLIFLLNLSLAACYIPLMNNQSNQSFSLVIYFSFAVALVSIPWNLGLFVKYSCCSGRHRYTRSRRGSRLQQQADTDSCCTWPVMEFSFDLSSGFLLALFAVLLIQYSPCANIGDSFKAGVCPLYNGAIAIGIILIPFYLSLVLIDLKTCCCGPSEPREVETGRSTQKSSQKGSKSSTDLISSPSLNEFVSHKAGSGSVWPPPEDSVFPPASEKYESEKPIESSSEQLKDSIDDEVSAQKHGSENIPAAPRESVWPPPDD